MEISHYKRASIEHSDRCEDAIVILQREGNAPVFAVIDGLGGHQHQNAAGVTMTGREASARVAEILIEDLAALPPEVDASPAGLAQQRLKAAILRANTTVFEELNSDPALPMHERVGAVLTVVILCENGKRLLCGQVGDTRAYLLTEGELLQVCIDEDNIEYLVRRNVIDEEDAATISQILNAFDGVKEPSELRGTITIHQQPYDLYMAWRWFLHGNAALGIPGANVVMTALGLATDDPTPQFSRLELSPQDALLLCSDGLHKNLTDSELLEKLSAGGKEVATRLGEAAYLRSQDVANRRRTPDDISAIVVYL